MEDFSTPCNEAAIRSLVDLDSIHTLSRKNKFEMKTKKTFSWSRLNHLKKG